MSEDYLDDEGAISIWKVMEYTAFPEDDPRHLFRKMRARLVQHRLTQIELEAAHNIALLRLLRGK